IGMGWRSEEFKLVGSSVSIMAVVPVYPGNTYVYSGFHGSISGGYLGDGNTSVGINVSATGSGALGYTFTVPDNPSIKFVALRVSSTSIDDVTYLNSFQVELGTVKTDYEPFVSGYSLRNSALKEKVPTFGQFSSLQNKVSSVETVTVQSKEF